MEEMVGMIADNEEYKNMELLPGPGEDLYEESQMRPSMMLEAEAMGSHTNQTKSQILSGNTKEDNMQMSHVKNTSSLEYTKAKVDELMGGHGSHPTSGRVFEQKAK